MDALVSKAWMIRLSLQPSPASETSAFNRMRAFNRRALSFADQRLQMLAFPRAQPHHILLYRKVLSRHARLRRQIATEANHLFLSNSLKRATSTTGGSPHDRGFFCFGCLI